MSILTDFILYKINEVEHNNTPAIIIINAEPLPAPIPIILLTVLARRPFLISIGVNIESDKNPTLAYDRMYLNGVINPINSQAFPCNSLEIFLIIERVNIEKIYT